MTNSFWREVLDHMPQLFLVFRVDENEEAHLIFVNSRVKELLGYKPEEFVLASESAGSHAEANIHSLVEKIARLSRQKKSTSDNIHQERGQIEDKGAMDEEADKHVFKMLSRHGSLCSFKFDFRIFAAKSISKPIIVVSMIPAPEKSEASFPDKPYRHPKQPFFVAESPLMKSLIQKMDILSGQAGHLLFRGEDGTGKKTLARQFLRTESLSGCKWEEWNLAVMTKTEQKLAVDRLCGNTGQIEKDVESAQDNAFCLLILEISQLSTENQVMLLDWLRKRSQAGRPVRILATSAGLLEACVQQGTFSTELYYLLSFETLLLPPLSQRKEDLRQLAEKWIAEASVFFGMDEAHISGKDVDRITAYSWPGNFPEFYDVMRFSLMHSKNGRLTLRLPSDQISSVEPSGKVDTSETSGTFSLADIVSFDEMNSRYLERVLDKTGGKIYGVDGAAHLLGMKPTTLQSKLKKLGVR